MDPNIARLLAAFFATIIATFAGQNYTMDGKDIETYVNTLQQQNHTIDTWPDFSTFFYNFTTTFKTQNPTINIETFNNTFSKTIIEGESQDLADDLKCVRFPIY
jgi:hypothetical protein